MKTTPKTEKEIAELNLLPKGWYPYTVNDATEKTSKAGNEMIELNLRVYKTEGTGFVMVRDFLMDTEFGAAKLRHIAETSDIIDQYERGGLNHEDLVDKEGFCKITIKQDKTGKYPDQNQIQDYAKQPPKPKADASAPAGAVKDPEDDIPF